MTATILIGARDWVWPALALATVGFAALVWGYRRVERGNRVRTWAFALKALALLALLAVLVDPLWSSGRPRPGANLFVLLADNSMGLAIRDQGESLTRGRRLARLLNDERAEWQVRLDQDFDVRRYRFDRRLDGVADFSGLDHEGRATALGFALRTLAERLEGRPLAGILLFTDGNATDCTEATLPDVDLPPVYPVVVGSDRPASDLAIAQVTVSRTAFEDAPVSIQADLRAEGYEGARVVAQLVDESGAVVQERRETAAADGDLVPLRFELRPERPGVSFYRVRVAAEDSLDQFEKPDASDEATLANNERRLVVEREAEPFRVLYVSGRPNWEFKFLNRALAEDDLLEMVGLIRVAKREPKFDWRGRAGESTNPLFRGFGPEDPEEAERYDQPVLVRIGVKDESELRDGFPKTAEELFTFHAVVLDDLEAEFFTQDQMTLLGRFVSERGGGFLMLGGQESFREGDYRHTPIADLLPVYLDAASDPASVDSGPVRLSLTREGWLQPWVRLRANEVDERARLDEVPEFRSVNRLTRIKPAASVLATVEDASGAEAPALVVQRFGRGRSAALTIGDLWRWGLHHDPVDRDLEKSWRQTVRWLVSDVPGRVEFEARTRGDRADESIRLLVRVRDSEHRPLDNAQAKVTVRPPGGDPVQLEAEPSLEEAGLYETTFVARDAGVYRADVVVTDGDGESVGAAQAGWAAQPAAEEFRSLRPDRGLLQALAEKTGGAIVPAEGIEEFVRGLSSRKAPITEQWSVPLWHRPSVFLLAVGLLLTEWGLRRWRGLP